ncbi:MAG: biopolymer transporter ExbD [Schleiferiaceae bacterium]|jgi:biopolymer transport protein ExbD|nr:biopolymer transporter ExbD [Flavobacteriales bacterium]MDG1220250.1 biopolymer transporter ExbD [Schleiferiaceae bacterium]MBT3572054.1 biopolymer transporter ExbD [Flavobacteriales bacterium]MBT3678005.1 biopolymer transporter ExbD [Flavobacteriales bacterium]MBT3739262.1 biopolymer transporter ExbD [Flavobacteriales bacterium]
MARNKRATPEINAGSMADIAFLLLIFFLVTTTMDVDKGLAVRLPPWSEEPQDESNDIKEKNIFVVLVNANNDLLVEDDYLSIDQLRSAAKDFIDNNGDGTCEVCRGLQLPSSSDNPKKAILSMQNDRGTNYSTYVTVRNELIAAYSELRQDLALRRFGIDYTDLSDESRKEINAFYPQIISEAEPVKIGG